MLKHDNQLISKDAQYVWHSMKPYNPESTMIAEKSNGSWIVDHNGRRFLDAMAGLWCVNAGYGREELAQAAYEQLKKLAYIPLVQTHEPAIKLAEKINEWLDDEYVIFFSNSGSEANEAAFKIARQYHYHNGSPAKYKVVSRYRSYHGNSFGALAATGQAQRKYQYEPLSPGFLHVAPPDTYRDEEPIQRAEEIDQIMTWELSETIGAVIMEPIITGGGVIMPPRDYMKRVQEICKKHDALFIVDEVICGFGRMGEKFGHQLYGVKPDIVTMAKGITSAYLPLSATAVRKDIYESFKGSGEYDFFRHVNTFGGNPAACAVALKNIEIFEREQLVERSKEKGKYLINSLLTLEEHKNVGNVRGEGLLVGIELVEDKKSKKPLNEKDVNQIIQECKNRNIIISKNGTTVAGYNNILTLSPPLNIAEEDLNYLIHQLSEVIWTVLPKS
ncbi:Adenosylmethionine-8-amino-7-oxononanoate aminotransferase [Salinibacillus kushneri]|uniref:Adenosylmethionine-8-amino-7-oxononanoate aminotransferase n=1 Tax=Salinibacillus kushneri TaxID=237682 RepID=A0A1H9ZC41_9BACI|nr:aspartate aminotransferase family protein [Salinibacillus kushneri]SES79036.1 Adenosylmethionine-8-amino-7-oxononanoate aminotransferase [Salinibacillus kushneri]